MKATIVGKPSFQMQLSKAQVDLLMKMASMHYDAACKAAGILGGFVYGWSNSKGKAEASWHELDICLKIMENNYGIDSREREERDSLKDFFRDLLRTASRNCQRWEIEYAS